MKRIFAGLLLSLLLLGYSPAAIAAACFWVGGTGSTDDATKWSSSSGGAGSTCAGPGGIPDASDTATWDASSGAGTVTVAAGGTWNLQTVTMGAFTGTWTNAANNRAIAVSGSGNAFNISGAGTRTINLGTATYTLSNNTATWQASTATNLSLTSTGASVVFSGTGTRIFAAANGQSYAAISCGAAVGAGSCLIGNATLTLGTMTIGAPNTVIFTSGATTNISSAVSWNGSSTNQIGIFATTFASAATIAFTAGSTMGWVAFKDIGATGSPSAINSFNLGGNSGIAISAPSGGGGGIIGGG